MKRKQTIVVITLLLLLLSLASPATALGKGHPDLKVISLTATLESPLENELHSVVLDWTIKNDGKKSSGPFEIQLINRNVVVETILYSGLLPWTSITDQKTLNLPSGEYTFSLVVDPINEVKEISDDNNIEIVNISVPTPPPPLLNLAISNVEYYPPPEERDLTTSDPIGVRFTVTNSGEASAEDIDIKVRLNEKLTIIDMTIGLLAPGESKNLQEISNYRFETHGEYKIDVMADPENLIPETNENDNSDKVLVYVHPNSLPNIALSNCFIFGENQQPSYALLGESLTFSCDIENNGAVPAYDFDFFVKTGELGNEIIFSEVMDLSPGEKRTITASTNWIFLEPGEIGFSFVAEAWFEEITLGDNIIYETVCVEICPPPILP